MSTAVGLSPRYRVEIGRAAFSCTSGESVLGAMERAGRCEIPVGCRGGGCGICKVRVIEGAFTTGKMSSAQVSADDVRTGIVLACRLYPQGDMRLAREAFAASRVSR